MGVLLIIVGVAVGLVVYFIPTMVASSRKATGAGGVLVLNLFFGWTLIGWVVALAWASGGAVESVADRRVEMAAIRRNALDGQNVKLSAEAKVLLARNDQLIATGTDGYVGLSGALAQKRLEKDVARWERQAGRSLIAWEENEYRAVNGSDSAAYW